ncbi:MAG: 4-amino-4-deoxy-L-arabinose transferase [Eubacteriales bacterium]|nr:4-amino-4-deoxy-L-arabinose transferase [Eubacteriales bacterium]
MKKYIVILIFVYFLINMFFLDLFPFIHSDESWLGGLSRLYLEERTPAVTESFFDLFPRYPHGIKIIFHYIQAFFILLMNYSPYTLRLISLLISCGVLFIFYLFAHKCLHRRSLVFLTVIVLATDVQFIYASHFARQEILILLLILLCAYIKLFVDYRYKNLVLSVLTGLAIGVHPNAFFIAVILGLLYGYDVLIQKSSLKPLITYVLLTGCFAMIYVLISLKMDPEFIYHYRTFGEQFGVFDDSVDRTVQIVDFYRKLFYQVSGTYYMPPIRLQLILFGIFGAITSLSIVIKKRDKIVMQLLLILLGINLTFILIGRFNQTSIVFIFPFAWLLVIHWIERFRLSPVIFVLLIVQISISSLAIAPYLQDHYQHYIREIQTYVPDDAKVLANLNTEFYFRNNTLYDYRNLNFLEGQNTSFESYILDREIEYIIYPEEMNFIYNRRPVWNGIYGNLYPYYDDMQRFFNDRCQIAHQFHSPYGMRLVLFQNNKDWLITIYKVVQ